MSTALMEFQKDCHQNHPAIGYSIMDCPLCSALEDLNVMTETANHIYDIYAKTMERIRVVEQKLEALQN